MREAHSEQSRTSQQKYLAMLFKSVKQVVCDHLGGPAFDLVALDKMH